MIEIQTHYASLSEAIRAGAKLAAQGSLMTYIRSSEGERICGLGGAAWAISGSPVKRLVETIAILSQIYPYVKEENSCPILGSFYPGWIETKECAFNNFPLWKIITHLNDDHRWTMEQIADWVEIIEESLGYVHLVEIEAPHENEQPIYCH